MRRKQIDIHSTVALDGAALKRIREEQKLTQLYVSKVVGVTTDTISRWENNRYPSMRRDNALKLAEALEVDLEELLFKPEPPSETELPPDKRLLPWVLAAILVVLLLVALVLLYFQKNKPAIELATVTAERILPIYAAPGTVIPVQVHLTHRANDTGFILREYLPKGWKLTQSSPPVSSIDNDSGIARWIIKSGDARERIVYLVQVDRSAKLNGSAVFQGEVVAGSGEGKAVNVQGNDQIAVSQSHWTDQNGDDVIDDGEMLQASYTVDEMAGVHIDWFELERLWSAGSYKWHDGQGKFVPVKPLETPHAPLKR